MRVLYRENKAFIDKLVFLSVFLVFAFVFIKYMFPYVSPFVFGFVISMVISPIVGFLQKHLRIKRGISTIFLIIVVITIAVIAGVYLVNKVFQEARYMSESLPGQLEALRDFMDDMQNRFDRFMSFIPDEFALEFEEIVNTLINTIAGSLGDVAKNASVNVVTKIPGFLLSGFLCLISAFFFTRDKQLIKDTLVSNLPGWLKTRVQTVQEGFFSAVTGYLRAELIIMSVVAAICILGLSILGYPYAVLMGIVICLMDALPIIGGSLIFWPWAIYCMVTGNYPYAVGLLLTNVACFFARQLLEPKVVGQQIGVHPLLVLVSLYVGLKLFGLAGLFLGPVLIVTAKLIMKSGAVIHPEPPVVHEIPVETTTDGEDIE